MTPIGHFVPIYNHRQCIWEVRRIGPSHKPTRKVWAIFFDATTATRHCSHRNPKENLNA